MRFNRKKFSYNFQRPQNLLDILIYTIFLPVFIMVTILWFIECFEFEEGK